MPKNCTLEQKVDHLAFISPINFWLVPPTIRLNSSIAKDKSGAQGSTQGSKLGPHQMGWVLHWVSCICCLVCCSALPTSSDYPAFLKIDIKKLRKYIFNNRIIKAKNIIRKHCTSTLLHLGSVLKSENLLNYFFLSNSFKNKVNELQIS